MTAKVWGAGGAGIGECPASGTGLDGGNFSGGSGGHVEGTIPVTGGSTVTVWVLVQDHNQTVWQVLVRVTVVD